MCLATAYLPVFHSITEDPLIDSINRHGSYKMYLIFRKLEKKFWDPNLSEASNRANIINIYDEIRDKRPYYPMLPNGELDVEALKLKREKEEKEYQEACLREEAERKAYEKSFRGKLEKCVDSFFSFLARLL